MALPIPVPAPVTIPAFPASGLLGFSPSIAEVSRAVNQNNVLASEKPFAGRFVSGAFLPLEDRRIVSSGALALAASGALRLYYKVRFEGGTLGRLRK